MTLLEEEMRTRVSHLSKDKERSGSDRSSLPSSLAHGPFLHELVHRDNHDGAGHGGHDARLYAFQQTLGTFFLPQCPQSPSQHAGATGGGRAETCRRVRATPIGLVASVAIMPAMAPEVAYTLCFERVRLCVKRDLKKQRY